MSRALKDSYASDDLDALLARAHAGSMEALGELFERYRPRWTRQAHALLGPCLRAKTDEADLVQEVFVIVVKKFTSFEGSTVGEFVAWVKRILRREVTRVTKRFRDTDMRDVGREVRLSECIAEHLRAGDCAGSDEWRERVDDALWTIIGALPALELLVLVLFDLERMRYGKIAGILHRSKNAVCTHFVVDDGDESLRGADLPGVEFILLPQPHRDRGNNARAVGSLLAISGHFDAIGYLDTNSWFEVDHLEQMVLLHERTGAAVCTAARNLVDGEGRLLRRCLEVDGENYVATSCLFLTRAAFELARLWFHMPQPLSLASERVIWDAVKSNKYAHAHRDVPTVNSRC